MFERYTEKARRVIFFARYEASQFGAPAIEPEHLLLGLMREDKTLTGRFFPRAQITIESIRREIEGRTLLRERIPTSVELPLAPETKRVLHYAHDESDRLKHRHIGTEHLLLGLMREEHSVAAQVLFDFGLRLESMRDQLAKKIDARSFDLPPMTRSNGRTRIVLGIERLQQTHLLRGARVGLVCNQASVDHRFRHVADLFHEHTAINLTALFGPQHGIRGDVQDNMVESAHGFDRKTGVPIHSLFSETREQDEEMLNDLYIIVFDLQD